MKIIAIAGKVDSRIIVYPLARAISLTGLTAVISDDGAYRRLYHGDDLKGTVSGVDISVGVRMDEDLRNSLNDEGMAYDNIILVTGGYIPSNVDGVILCKGIDKSMTAESDTEEKEEIKPVKQKKRGLRGKKKGEKEDDIDEDTGGQLEADEVKEEKKVKKDEFIVPEGVPSIECYISFERPSTKGDISINLRDSAIRYIYSCEETKSLDILTDKSLNKTIAKLASKVLDIEETNMFKMLTRKEYENTGKVK